MYSRYCNAETLKKILHCRQYIADTALQIVYSRYYTADTIQQIYRTSDTIQLILH